MADHIRPLYADMGNYLASRFPYKVQKISLNAGFSCPNRDGTKGWGGCSYCNNQTFSPDYCHTGRSITEQLDEGIAFFARKYPEMKYLAYFQAYTGTYGEMSRLVTCYEEALAHAGVVGLIIGTRPDCMPGELLEYLATLSRRCYMMVEYGIESTLDATLLKINRGHDYACAVDAVRRTAREYEREPADFHFYAVDEYIDLAIDFIERLRPDIVVERFVSQSPDTLLIAPRWGLKNHEFSARLLRRMRERGTYQGRLYEKQK